MTERAKESQAASTRAPLDALDAFNASHPMQRSVLNAVEKSVGWAKRDHKITVVIGPSGVGKDRLIALVTPRLAETGNAPVVVEAPPEIGSQAFSMGGLLELILSSLGDPAPSRHTLTYGVPGLPLQSSKTGAARLVAVRNRLTAVAPAALIINEAGYLASGTERQQSSNIRNLTWLADQSIVPIVLVGTYSLTPLIRRNEDANRRIRPAHYPRYRDTPVQLAGFQEATGAYDDELLRLGLRDDAFSLASIARQLYDGTFGCVGLLSAWVRNAAERATDAKRCVTAADVKGAQSLIVADAKAFKEATTEGEIAALGLGKPLLEMDRATTTKAPKLKVVGPRPPVGERRLGRDETGLGRGDAKSA